MRYIALYLSPFLRKKIILIQTLQLNFMLRRRYCRVWNTVCAGRKRIYPINHMQIYVKKDLQLIFLHTNNPEWAKNPKMCCILYAKTIGGVSSYIFATELWVKGHVFFSFLCHEETMTLPLFPYCCGNNRRKSPLFESYPLARTWT